MKAATGELNLTVITLIAIAAVIGFFWLMWPKIQDSLNTQWKSISNNTCAEYENGHCVKYKGSGN